MGNCASVNKKREKNKKGSGEGMQPFKEAAESNKDRRKRHEERVAEYCRVEESKPEMSDESSDDVWSNGSISNEIDVPRYGSPNPHHTSLSPPLNRSLTPSAMSTTETPPMGSILLTGPTEGTTSRSQSPSRDTSVVFVVAPRRSREVSRSRSQSPSTMTAHQASQQFAAGNRSPRDSFEGSEHGDDGITLTTVQSFSQRCEHDDDDDLIPFQLTQPKHPQRDSSSSHSLNNGPSSPQLLTASWKFEDEVANRRSFDNRNTSFNDGGLSDCEEPELLPVDNYEVDRSWRKKIARRGSTKRSINLF